MDVDGCASRSGATDVWAGERCTAGVPRREADEEPEGMLARAEASCIESDSELAMAEREGTGMATRACSPAPKYAG